MNTPEWLIPGSVGAALGGVIVAAVGFTTAGWMTDAQANAMAQKMGRDRVMAAMVPVCVERSRADPERLAHLATIQQASGTGRRDALMTTGWAMMADSQTPDRDLAAACLAALELPTS
jgi:hypothetical protein